MIPSSQQAQPAGKLSEASQSSEPSWPTAWWGGGGQEKLCGARWRSRSEGRGRPRGTRGTVGGERSQIPEKRGFLGWSKSWSTSVIHFLTKTLPPSEKTFLVLSELRLPLDLGDILFLTYSNPPCKISIPTWSLATYCQPTQMCAVKTMFVEHSLF